MKVSLRNYYFANLRCKKMAWMQELQWDWHIVFTDAFSSTLPARLTTEPCHKENSLGFSTENESQAPPVKPNLLEQIKSFAVIKHPKWKALMNHNAEFGKRVRNARKNKGFTQDELAAMAGINRGYMGEIERGSASPSLNKIVQISKALKIDLEQLTSCLERP